MTNAFLYFFAAVFGLVFGSFANVAILRDGERLSILNGRSRCPSCGYGLRWYDLVPVLSFLALRGRCRSCKAAISWQYPAVELASAGLAAAAAWYGVAERGSLILAVGIYAAALLFLIISVIDLRTMEVPVDYAMAAAAVGAIAQAYAGVLTWQEVVGGLAAGAGAIGFVLYGWKLATGQDGMGTGDIWLAGAIGAIVGYPLIAVSLASAVFSGAAFGVLAIAASRKSAASAIPFGPFLFFGMLLALGAGQPIADWYILGL